MINVGVIGLGVGESHAKAFQALDNCTVKTICDIDQDKLNAVGKLLPEAKLEIDANSILNDPSINAVCIASFDNFHKSQVIQALDQGKHVFVEKPLCLNREEALEIREALDRNLNLKLTSNLILRKSPRFIDLKQRLENGQFGALSYIEGDYNYGRIHKITEGWRGKIPFYSVVLGGGLHLVDLILWLTEDRVVSVSAMGNNIHSRGSQYQYNDLIVALLSFESGMVAKVASNYGCVHPHFHVLNVYGETATFLNSADDATIFRSREPSEPPLKISTPYPGVEKGALVKNFVDSILNNSALEIATDEVFDALSVCLAIEESMQTSESATVKYI